MLRALKRLRHRISRQVLVDADAPRCSLAVPLFVLTRRISLSGPPFSSIRRVSSVTRGSFFRSSDAMAQPTRPFSSNAAGPTPNETAGGSTSSSSSTAAPSPFLDSAALFSKVSGTLLTAVLLYYLYSANWSVKKAEAMFVDWLRTWPLYPPPKPGHAEINSRVRGADRLDDATVTLLSQWFVETDRKIEKGGKMDCIHMAYSASAMRLNKWKIRFIPIPRTRHDNAGQ